jgi:hypothetical protein
MTVQVLYKYGSLNGYSEALFSTPTIWFSSPAQLNDPFECCPWFTFNGTQDQFVEFLTRELRRRNPQLTSENAAAHASRIFLEGRHRDPAIWSHVRQTALLMLGKRIGLHCLSKINDSILMWSHYSQYHHGYCLEFEATGSTPFFGKAHPVGYAADYPAVDFFNTPKEKQFDLIFLTKHIGWSYEEEWRIIDHKVGSGIHEYPAKLLRGVIFGIRMPENDRAMIRAWTQKRGHPVKFYEATQNDRQFKIDIRAIE